MAQPFLEGFQRHGVKRGDAFAFYAGDIRVEGQNPFCLGGGNLGNGRTRTAMYTDSIEQLRDTAGARQVRFRAETAPAAFATPSSGGWIMFGNPRTEARLSYASEPMWRLAFTLAGLTRPSTSLISLSIEPERPDQVRARGIIS